MKSAEQIRQEMDAEDPGRDWEAEGGAGWDTVKEFHRRTVVDVLEAAAALCEASHVPYADCAIQMADAIRGLKPSST